MTADEARRLAVVETRVETIEEKLTRIDANTTQLAAQANRWKGAIVVLLGVGGAIGWVISLIAGHLPWGK